MLDAFLEALANIARRKITPSAFNSAQWRATAPAIRQVSFFSATVDKVRALAGYKRMLMDWSQAATEEIEGPYGKATVYRVGGQADFIEQARTYLQKEGLDDGISPLSNEITNIAGAERLKLVFNTNIQQANQLATWQSHVQDADYLNRNPAARFVRMPGATTTRPRHVEAEGQVRRWDDFTFWLYQNAPEIGGFGVPWGPWGFNSYMTQEPVKRAEAERLGLVRPGEILRPIDARRWGIAPSQKMLNHAKANLRDIPPTIRKEGIKELRDQLGADIVDDNGKLSLQAFRTLRANLGI